jgi:3-hydroxymyristoyl/3-hydroxydecanoyl-(acyl carrier protein) dehydratase
MPGMRFRDFSFVDRITHCAAGRVTGRYAVPRGVRFPASLMAEAVGQLAAWAAMAQLDFAARPVAGLADETRYARAAVAGETLELQAQLERCDAEAVSYGGRARIGTTTVCELIHCVGPMLPMAEFDDPDAMRADYTLLTGAGAPADRFSGVPLPQLSPISHEPGVRREARLDVPAADAVAYFADHFPRRPVFPGTLLMDAVAGLAVELAAEASGQPAAALMPRQVGRVKIRAFTPPGTALTLEVSVAARDGSATDLKIAARNDGRTIATARMIVAPVAEVLA